MEPRIVQCKEKLVVGFSAEMSLVENTTSELWKSFRVRTNEIVNRTSEDFISLQLFPEGYFDAFNPMGRFVKWACVEVSDVNHIPDKMNLLTIPNGLYAVFNYVGTGADPSIFQYIYEEWIPNSEYQLDDRPHFEVLGDKYKHNDPTSEEEIWIPITKK